MDRVTCINNLMAAGVTWWMAVCYFHDQLIRLGNKARRERLEHLCVLAREDAQLRSEA